MRIVHEYEGHYTGYLKVHTRIIYEYEAYFPGYFIVHKRIVMFTNTKHIIKAT